MYIIYYILGMVLFSKVVDKFVEAVTYLKHSVGPPLSKGKTTIILFVCV